MKIVSPLIIISWPGEQTYTITLKKLVAVTPHGNSEAESTIEQIKVER